MGWMALDALRPMINSEPHATRPPPRKAFTCIRLQGLRQLICVPASASFFQRNFRRCRLGITPLATLHHFVHPMWFEKLGAFEKEANIPLYLSWVQLAYKCVRIPLCSI